MSTLSQFFGSASTGGGTQTTSTMRVFTQTGSLTLPSDTVYVAYGALGGGGQWSTASSNTASQRRSGAGAGFAFKEGAHSGAATICAVVALGGRPCECCTAQMKTQGGTSCVSGFTPGTICATGGCCAVPGCGVGGDINTCGGKGGWGSNCLGGAGAGGLYGNGGTTYSSGGGGYGSGGGGGAGGMNQQYENTCTDWCDYAYSGEPIWRVARGGGGGQPGGEYNGGNGLAGQGGVEGWGRGCTGLATSSGHPATGGFIPQYGKCGYSQAKTYFAAAGGGGAKSFVGQSNEVYNNNPHGAPGGGGGGGNSTCSYAGGGNGGFGAGAGGGTCSSAGGFPGFGAGSSTSRPDDASNVICGGPGGDGVVAVEYWVG